MTELAIETTDLTKHYLGTRAVDGLELRVQSGTLHALAGPNGAGKSTVGRLLVGLERPTRGDARLLGVDSRHLDLATKARLGYVSGAETLPGSLRVGSYLAYLRPFYPQWDEDLCTRLVCMLDLPLNRPIRTLSLGAKTKVALLASLAYRPRLLILDEPFGALDPMVRDDVVEALLEIVHEGESTLLVMSHEMAILERLVDRITFVSGGRKLFEAEIESLLRRSREVSLSRGAAALVAEEDLPESWVCFRREGERARWVDLAWDEDEPKRGLPEGIPADALDARRLSLHEISSALLRRTRRQEAA